MIVTEMIESHGVRGVAVIMEEAETSHGERATVGKRDIATTGGGRGSAPPPEANTKTGDRKT